MSETEQHPIDSVDGDLSRRGGNQVGLKQYNERLIVSLVQRHGSLTKAEMTKITRLSPQTVSSIVNRLLQDEVFRKKKAIRGKIGQPSTPVELNPEGAFSIGVKIGRNTLDLVLLSLDRAITARQSVASPSMEGAALVDLIKTSVAQLKKTMSREQARRLVGLGIAAPTAIEDGQAVIGDAGSPFQRARVDDVVVALEKSLKLPVFLLNDATAACLAEVETGRTNPHQSMIYFYLGTFIGGGLVLNGKLVAGRTGNAGAVGAVPLGLSAQSKANPPPQLIETASLATLEALAHSRGQQLTLFIGTGTLDAAARTTFDAWCNSASDALALAAISGASFVEAETIVMDGVLARPLMEQVIAAVKARIAHYNREGIVMPQILMGESGSDARALGAALLPLNENFAPSNQVMLKN